MKNTRQIIIDLNNSLFAQVFTSNQQIHQEDLDKAMGIIETQLNSLELTEDPDVFLSHIYRTIGVFGDRGSGKTSFMISLLTKCKNELNKVEVLRMIDPTLVEHKKPIVLCVIAMIQQKVEFVLKTQECNTTGQAYVQRREWEKLMERISRGIFAIDKVGKDFDNSMWQDESYVMRSGLPKVMDANAFEENLRKMIKMSLDILGKRAFILAFDDIDVDLEQGWNVLESLRRYLSDTHIISIVSGNIKLYGTLVRYELGRSLKMPMGTVRDCMENELESQYMLKLLNPSNRINLLSLAHLLQNGNTVTVKYKEEEVPVELKQLYCRILDNFGIMDASSQKIFVNFLLSMSLRSQIHFMIDACAENKNTPPLDVFSSRLYAAGIDMGALGVNVLMINIALLEYLNSKANLSDCYLFMPTLPNKDINSNFTALTFMECWYLKTIPYLGFDYLLRIGYIRNLVVSLEQKNMVLNLCIYAGWNQVMSLKNNIGLSMAYVAGKKLGSMKEHISLYAMEQTAKKTQNNALDSVLKVSRDSFANLMAMFPYVRITHNKDNESRSYYSLIALLAVIGDLLKCTDKEEMIVRINDLKLFRSYQMPQEGDYFGEGDNIDGDDYGVETKEEDVEMLAELMSKWKSAYKDCYLPPYALGRIMTRLYSALSNVAVNNVGVMMNVMVANFFNSCLIEETRVRIPVKEQGKINNSNLRSDTKCFTDNLGKISIVNQLPFTKWMMSCPMLNCFLDEETYDKVQEFAKALFKIQRAKYPVYDLLCKINSKVEKNETHSFSGRKNGGWEEMAKVLRDNGVNDDLIQEKIVKELDINKAIDFIKETGLFKTVPKSCVNTFRKHFHRQDATVEAEPPHHHGDTPKDSNE